MAIPLATSRAVNNDMTTCRFSRAIALAGTPGEQRQNRLRAVQRLHLAFFVHTQHDRPIRGIHIQPNAVPQLLHNRSLENLKFSRCG